MCQWDDVLKPFIYEHKTVFFNYVDMFSFINTLSIPKDFLIDFTDSLNKFCLENNFNFTHVDLNISEFGFEQLIENENMSSYTVYFLLKNNFINGLIKNNKSIIIKAINKIKNDKLLLYNFFMNNYIEDSNMDDFGVFKEIDFIVK